MNRELGKFFSYGTNHKYAPLCFREALYLNPQQLISVLPEIRSRYPLQEIAILSTCNRLEMYGVSFESDPNLFLQVFYDLQTLANKSDIKKIEDIKDHTFCHTGRDAIQHVFGVAASIDSLIIGETQITGQFKDAFSIAQEAQTLGPHLYHLSQKALRIAKKVRSETVIGQKTVSIGHAAIDLSRKIFSNLSEKNLLLLGAGDIAQVTGLYAKKLGIQNISIVNRSQERAQDLVKALGGGRIGLLSELSSFLVQADIVITALSSDHPIIDPSLLKSVLSKRKNRPMYIVDIAIPRNVDSACGDFENIYLFELDDLQHYVDQNLSERESAAQQAKLIIETSLDSFCQKILLCPESSIIQSYHRYVERIILQESRKSLGRKELKNLTEQQQSAIQKMLESIHQKLTSHFALAIKSSKSEKRSHFKDLVYEIEKTHPHSEG